MKGHQQYQKLETGESATAIFPHVGNGSNIEYHQYQIQIQALQSSAMLIGSG